MRRVGVNNSLRRCLLVDGAVDGQFNRSQRGGSVVFIDAGLYKVVLFQAAEPAAAASYYGVICQPDAEIAAVGGNQPLAEEVVADGLKLL
jgi:hypothetical protein